MKFAAVVIFVIEAILSHTPGEKSGEESRWLARTTGIKEGLLRQSAHVVLFFLLSLFAALGFDWWGVGAVTVWAAVDEISKKIVPGRHSSGGDMILNLAGVAVGVVIWFLLGAG